MGHNYLLFLTIILALVLFTNGINPETRKLCCNLGTNHSASGSDCKSFQTPISGVRREDEALCMHFVDVCCKNHLRDIQCNLGRDDAKVGSCSAIGEGERKVCCEACEIGLATGKSGESCQDTIGLNAPYDTIFIACCEDASKTTPTTSTTPTYPTSELLKATKPSGRDSYYPFPSMESLCESENVCAHICEPTVDSYICACSKGFILMDDGVSCKPIKRALKKGGRCDTNNPCDQDCTDTGTAIKCSCREGYELAPDKRTCKDIDECALGIHDCVGNEECINDEGTYDCYDPNDLLEVDNINFDNKCPEGFKFNGEKQVCDDVDECQFEITCPRPKTCKNTIGSFVCEGEDRPQCPPGFYYKPATESCADIDECVDGNNDCNKESQDCLNTKGNYTCIDKASRNSCPPGFKKNSFTQLCDDINECEENDDLCKVGEVCVNEPGGHTCAPSKGRFSPPQSPPTTRATPTTRPTTTTTTTTTQKPTTPYRPVSCPTGYKYVIQTNACVDVDECAEDREACDSNQDCVNTPGSYACNCKTGFKKEYQTGACVDLNECQLGVHDCTVAERCDNTIGSFYCARITGCGTGYTLSYSNGLCEDDDECVLGTHNCNELGPNFRCRNLLGSYRCEPIRPVTVRTYPTAPARPPTVSYREPTVISSRVPTVSFTAPTVPATVPTRFYTRPPQTRFTYPVRPSATQNYPMISGQLKKCLPGYRMNERGECEDINECESNPCGKGEKCLNFNGRYQCTSPRQCTIGFELDEDGDKCVDVNECTRGTHKCNPSQICKNGVGYYICDCPPGHHLSRVSQTCEDIDECKMYRPCGSNSDCINTVGSFKCNCKSGFKKEKNYCEDVDECKEINRLCEHSCVNTWGSYRCACKSGFTLNYDNRTCTDLDECDRFKDKNLCIGTCKNVPGSYVCECPKGYKLGSDARICNDVDECNQNVCSPEDICINTRGSFKCYSIDCPKGYMKDPEHKSRCKRSPSLCDPRDYECVSLPEQYTYQYMTLVSNLPLSQQIQLFQVKGPQWPTAKVDFKMSLKDVSCPYGVQRVNDHFFRKQHSGFNSMQLFLVRSIQGPQEIKLQIEMRIFNGNAMIGNVVIYLVIIVSEHSF